METWIVSLVGMMLTILGGLITSTWVLQSWLNRRFIEVRDLIEKKISYLLEKLEYHERHDDQRFNELKNDLMAIKLRNAAIDGRRPLIAETKETNHPPSNV